MEEYIEILKFKGYTIKNSYYENITANYHHCVGIDKNDDKINIWGLDKFDYSNVYDIGSINLDINEFRMLLDLFWREYEEK